MINGLLSFAVGVTGAGGGRQRRRAGAAHQRSAVAGGRGGRARRRAQGFALLLWLPLASGAEYWTLPIPAQGPPPADAIPAVADLSAAACGICHVAQWASWRGTWHARSVSAGLLGQLDQLDGATVTGCLNCHAPREESASRWWADGLAAAADLGPVDCTACHVRAQVRHGPRARPITPHGPVPETPGLRDPDFCAPCHQFADEAPRINGKPLQDTHAEWRRSRYAREGRTCQGCHMPGGDHGIRGIHDPDLTRQGLGLRVRRTAAGLAVAVGNQGAGHGLPTYATPRIVLTLAGLAPDGTEVAQVRHVIGRQLTWSADAGWREVADTRLLPDDWRTLSLALAADQAGRVQVTVDPGHDYHGRVYPELLRRWDGVLDPAARRLLEQARAQTSAAAYTLYQAACPPWQGLEQDCELRPGMPAGGPGVTGLQAPPGQ